jgi:nucleotide-binding universal stress UspA family protein
MQKIEKIMVALAFGNHSKGLFDFAVSLAGPLNADLIAVSIINERDINTVGCISSMGYEVDGDHYISSVREEREKACRRLAEEADFPMEKLKIIIKTGHPASKLIDICKEEKADMIVMGPKGRTSLETVIIGSVAHRLFRHSPVTVVTYRGGSR